MPDLDALSTLPDQDVPDDLQGFLDLSVGADVVTAFDALCSFVDQSVEAAQEAVRAIGEGLKAGLNALQASLTFLLDIYEGLITGARVRDIITEIQAMVDSAIEAMIERVKGLFSGSEGGDESSSEEQAEEEAEEAENQDDESPALMGVELRARWHRQRRLVAA